MAREIAGLWWLMLALGVMVFVVFGVALLVGLFRGPPDQNGEGEAERRVLSRWVVAGGVLMPVAVLLVVAGYTVRTMRAIANEAPPGALAVDVVGHQWWWEVRYPDEGVVTANELHLPVGRAVALRVRSADVIHSFWIPALGGKIDLLPDATNMLVLEADEPGVHRTQCAEFCGVQHAKMRLMVVAEPEEQFEAWVEVNQRAAVEPRDVLGQRGQEVFFGVGCASCHAIRGTAAAGTSGPDLTHVAARDTIGAGTVPLTGDHLADWIEDPHQVKPGVKMPPTGLRDDQMDALLAYLEQLE